LDYKKRSAKTLGKRLAHFIQLAELKHGKDKYDYTLARKDYVNTRSYVRIGCNQCGKVFKTLPQAHTSKKRDLHGACPNCHIPSVDVAKLSTIRWRSNKQERIETFRKKIRARHGDRIEFPRLEAEYRDESSTLTVHCRICDATYQRKARCLKDPTRYGGCPECNKEAMKRKIVEKNKERQQRNQNAKYLAQPYGCIYQITNKVNAKFYIGYTTMQPQKRLKAHWDESVRYARGHNHCRSYLHHAMIKYGREAFSIEVLEAYTNVTPYYLAEREVAAISRLKPHYNISKGGEIGQFKKGKNIS
jgi:predicted GIY-YIG superfamily endonuclease/Zn finger protein HypA/HybF involved in hydrogenase expression